MRKNIKGIGILLLTAAMSIGSIFYAEKQSSAKEASVERAALETHFVSPRALAAANALNSPAASVAPALTVSTPIPETSASMATVAPAATGVPAASTAPESDMIEYVSDVYRASANVPFTLPGFTVQNSNTLAIAIYTSVKTNFTITFQINGGEIQTKQVQASDSGWDTTTSGTPYFAFMQNSPAVNGAYAITITFPTDMDFGVYIFQSKSDPAATDENASLNKTSATITKGFTETLKVSGSSSKVTWSSSDSKVVTVSQSGKITGKKKGSATVKAALSSGKILTCKVTVKNNVYSAPKMKLKNAVYGKAYISITKVAYKKDGLLIKANFLNNSGHTITKLRNVKVKITNQNGKVIGTYSLKSKKVSIGQRKAKDYTYTLKKSKLKNKKTQDLRNIYITASWKFQYIE